MLFECLVNDPDSKIEQPPFLIDFDGEPQPGDFIYRGEGPDEMMYQVQARFWRKTIKPVRSEVFQQNVNKAVHACFLGVRLIATAQAEPEKLDG